jgi:ABC-type transport system involved in multi-copper enzyme maturation permease subunit
MTIATPVSPLQTGQRYRISTVMGAEWIKMRSVRSTIWTVTAMTVITLGGAIVAGLTIPGQWHTFSANERATFDPTNTSLKGLLIGQLVIGVLGVMVMSAEYGTGTIRATLAAVPNRPLIVATKAAVFAMIAAVVGQVLSFGAFLLTQGLLSNPAPHASLSQPGVLRAVVGSGLLVPVLGVFALGLATIIRHTAGAITAFVGTLLVLPISLEALPASISHPILNCLPPEISQNMGSVVPTTGSGWTLSPWAGFGVLCLYAVVTLGIGAWLMVRRDA